jgi:hypothetical protein
MKCEPTASVLVLYVAVPELFSVPVPRVAEPSMNVAVPVGVFDPLVVTVAVKITGEPAIAGFALETTFVVVAGVALTVWVSTAEVLPKKKPTGE